MRRIIRLLEVAITGLSGLSDDAAYRGMDVLLDALSELAAEVFGQVAHPLKLDLDIVFVDTTSTYFQCDVAEDDVETADGMLADDEVTSPVEGARRTFGHSKDHRGDLPQVVIAMAVTRDGVPVRYWTFDGCAG